MARHPAIPELPWYASYLAYHAGYHQASAQWARLATVHGCYVGTCPQRVGFEVCSETSGHHPEPQPQRPTPLCCNLAVTNTSLWHMAYASHMQAGELT